MLAIEKSLDLGDGMYDPECRLVAAADSVCNLVGMEYTH